MDCGIWSRFHSQLSNNPCDDSASGYCGISISWLSEFGVPSGGEESSCDVLEVFDTSKVRNVGLLTISIRSIRPIIGRDIS